MDDNESRNAPSGAIPINTKPTTTSNATASTSRYERIPLNTNTMRTATYEDVQIQRHDSITLKSAPGPVTFEQIAILLDNLNLHTEVQCIQKVTSGNEIHHEITLKDGYDIQEVSIKLFKDDIDINGNQLGMVTTRKLRDIVRNPITKVLIFEAPYELQDRYILQKFAPYGQLQTNSIYSHKIRGCDIYNGVRSINFLKLHKPIPTVLFVRGNRIKIKHDSQDRTPICGICKVKGHFRDDCPRLQELIDKDLRTPEADANPTDLPTSEIRNMLKQQEEKQKEEQRARELKKVIEEKKRQQETERIEKEQRLRRFYDNRKRMTEERHEDQNDDLEEPEREE